MSTQIQLNQSSNEKKVTVHVLPCHIAHDGPSGVSDFFHTASHPEDETVLISYFRGRRLLGRTQSLPEKYTGNGCIIISSKVGHVFLEKDSGARVDRARYGEDDDEDEEIETTNWRSGEKFDSLTVWEHQNIPDRGSDHWMRGIEEWAKMAEVVRSH